MKVDCEIVGATIVTPQGSFVGTITILNGRIAGIPQEPTGQAARTIDADGLVALPGMVDQHVHFMDPGAPEREDFIHGSSGAALAGVTTVVEHTHSQPVLTASDLREKVDYLEGRSVVDFGLTAHVFPHTIDHVPELCEAGALVFKAFTCTTHGVPALLNDDLLRFFRVAAVAGARALVHCEDEFITEDNEQLLRRALRADYGVIPEWRSSEAELAAVNTVALLCRLTGATVTVAHASQPRSIDLVQRERTLGARLRVESCPQYFYLSEDDVRTHGPTRKFTPPARDLDHPNPLWSYLQAGAIDIISSDHAPSTLDQKYAGTIWDCPFGLPGIDTTLTMLLNAVHEGWITLETVARVYSANPARLLGLYPRKGALQAGADADIVLVDLGAEHVLRNDQIQSKAGWTPYDGKPVHGLPVMTMLRGTVVAEEGMVVAPPGTGRFVTRSDSV
jgi:dihydroorotase (multifunctional complex type)